MVSWSVFMADVCRPGGLQRRREPLLLIINSNRLKFSSFHKPVILNMFRIKRIAG